MKDKIFLIWSGNNSIVSKLKTLLETEHNYICYVGGNFENTSSSISIGDTVIRQLNMCNQAIVVFANRSDGNVSSNLFFELGFATAKYGMKKIHCVKRASDQIALPSDFDNSFVESIPSETDDQYVSGIIEYFLRRQRLSVDTNKMYLINNRYLIHEMLQTHYSEIGSKCSDYELAQYVLFYGQSGVMYQDDAKILDELQQFKKNHYSELSPELQQSINISTALLEVQINLVNDGSIVYISDQTFRKYYNACYNMLDDIADDNSGTYDEWARVILAENTTYVCQLYSANPHLSEKMKSDLAAKVIKKGMACLEYIDSLEASTPCIENNDKIGMIALFKAYIYRHLFNASCVVDSENAKKWLDLSLIERRQLLRSFDGNSIDSKIYSNFEMEYYLSLVEYLERYADEDIDDFEKMIYIDEINSYVVRYKNSNTVHPFIRKIVNYGQTQ